MDAPKLVRLGTIMLDTTRGSLRGPDGAIHLRRQSFEVLRYLSERPEVASPDVV